MKYSVFLILIIISFSCNDLRKKKSFTQPKIDYYLIDSLELLFNEAYEKLDTSSLRILLNHLSEISKPKDIEQIILEIEKDIYSIFTRIYKPDSLAYLTNNRWNDGFYSSSNYFLVQNSIRFCADNKAQEIIVIDNAQKLWDFRPELKFKNAKLIYLKPELDSAINRFLNHQYIPLGDNNLMIPAEPKLETKKRKDFLSKELKILYGHWGSYWHLETHPEIEIISFNSKRDSAFVSYRIRYSFWSASFVKQNDKWILSGIKANGVE